MGLRRFIILAMLVAGCSQKPYNQEPRIQKTNGPSDLTISFVYDSIMTNQQISLIPSITNNPNIKKQKITHLQSSNKMYEINCIEKPDNLEMQIISGELKENMLGFMDIGLDGIVDEAYIYEARDKETNRQGITSVRYDIRRIPVENQYHFLYNQAIKEIKLILDEKVKKQNIKSTFSGY